MRTKDDKFRMKEVADLKRYSSPTIQKAENCRNGCEATAGLSKTEIRLDRTPAKMGERQLLAWRKGYLCRRGLLMICWNGVPPGICPPISRSSC
jgi:hypothetical protein